MNVLIILIVLFVVLLLAIAYLLGCLRGENNVLDLMREQKRINQESEPKDEN